MIRSRTHYDNLSQPIFWRSEGRCARPCATQKCLNLCRSYLGCGAGYIHAKARVSGGILWSATAWGGGMQYNLAVVARHAWHVYMCGASFGTRMVSGFGRFTLIPILFWPEKSGKSLGTKYLHCSSKFSTRRYTKFSTKFKY